MRLAKTHVVDASGITENDKGVSWDGSFIVYKNGARRKEDVLGKIPVQVKTIHSVKNNNRFSIDKADLINYKKETRIMYFYIVLSENDNATIYYLPLQLWDIETGLKEYGNKESKTFTFKRFPEKIESIIDILYGFISDYNKQKVLLPGILSYQDLVKQKGKVPISFEIRIKPNTSLFDIPDLINEQQPYIMYKNEDTNLEFVVDRFKNGIFKIKVTNAFTVGVDDEIFFHNVSAEGKKNKFDILCTEGLKIHIEEQKMTFTYNFSVGTVDEKYYVANFLMTVCNKKSLQINGNTIILQNHQIVELSNKVDVWYKLFSKYTEIAKALHIRKEPDFKNASESDYFMLDVIHACIVLKKPVKKLQLDNGLHFVKMFGINLFIGIVSSDELSFIFNWCDENFIKINNTEKELIDLPTYFLLERLDNNLLFEIDNIDYKSIEEPLFKMEITDVTLASITNIVINMISFYDSSKETDILYAALKISNHILLIKPEDINSVLNKSQILLRIDKFEESNKNEIQSILEKNKKNHLISFACYTIIGEKSKV